MSPLPAARPRAAAKPIDDFEWPPTADELSVYEMGPEPWQTRQAASRPVPAARPVSATRPVSAARPVSATRQRERPQPHQKRAADPAPKTMRKLAAVLAAAAIVAAAAGCVLYASMAQPVPVRAVHHPAPPVAVTPPPPPITIVATYPVEPGPSNAAPASHESAVVGDTAAAAQPRDSGDVPRVPLDAMPVDAPAEEETAPGPSEAAAPSADPASVDPGTTPPDAGFGRH